MKLLKIVIIGKVPIVCNECTYYDTFHRHDWNENAKVVTQAMCNAVFGKSLGEDREGITRPDWCPLISTADMPGTEDGYGWIVEDPDDPWKEVKR